MKAHNPVVRFLLVAFGLFVLLAGGAYAYLRSQVPETRAEQASYAAQRGGDYLVRHQLPDGSFEYRYDPANDALLSGYNMLRHAGTTYALFELFGATHDERYREAGEQALAYLRGSYAPCPAPHADLTCSYDSDTTVKLGGNALAILALTEYIRTTGDESAREEARSLAEWLVSVESPDGEFTIHVQSSDGEVDDHVSEYYPGEAIYALMRLAEVSGEHTWSDAAARAAHWLIEVRDQGKTSDTIAHDHWLLYGLRELYAIDPDSLYLAHVKKITDGIVSLQHTDETDVSYGGYYTPPRSTPTATRSEGLAAAYTIFVTAGEDVYAHKAFDALDRGVQFELRTFIDGRTARSYPNPIAALGGFRASLEDPEVRIDFVQHNISALLAYDAIERQ